LQYDEEAAAAKKKVSVTCLLSARLQLPSQLPPLLTLHLHASI
jgi:hypothetical protein